MIWSEVSDNTGRDGSVFMLVTRLQLTQLYYTKHRISKGVDKSPEQG